MIQRRRAIRKASGRGYTLLEVIIALAILGGSMVVVGRGFFIGYRSVRQARMVNTANRIADSTMAQLAAGVIEPQATGNTAVSGMDDWTYKVEIESASEPGLLSARVVVANSANPNRVVSVSIVRYLIDPDYDPLEARSSQ